MGEGKGNGIGIGSGSEVWRDRGNGHMAMRMNGKQQLTGEVGASG